MSDLAIELQEKYEDTFHTKVDMELCIKYIMLYGDTDVANFHTFLIYGSNQCS